MIGFRVWRILVGMLAAGAGLAPGVAGGEGEASAGGAAELRALLADPAIARIRLADDIVLAEPLVIGRAVILDGGVADGSRILTGDLRVEAAGVRLARLRLDGELRLEGPRRMDLEDVQANRVARGPVTFYFEAFRPVGFFANGDAWALGPLILTRITPDFDGRSNGWEVNPVVEGPHGFQDGGRGGFDATLVPALPYRAEGTVSIVKTTPTGERLPCIETAMVLTVVEAVPPGGGAEVFRPPYVGGDKPFYRVADLRTDLLPSFAPVEPRPTLAAIERRFAPLQMDHKRGVIGRSLRPRAQMRDYQPKNTADQSNAALRLMLDDPIEDRLPALIAFVQFGIDKLHLVRLGQTWPAGGGHQPGHRLPAAFAAVLLDLEEDQTRLRDAAFFHGSVMFHEGARTNGLVLWGAPQANERGYWNYIVAGRGNRSLTDPYGHIDGGRASEGAYQVITSQAHKGEILATHLMPALRRAWNPAEWERMRNYTDRWVLHGQWTRPDPHAPYDGEPANQGVSWGPDPRNPGRAIRGEGRFVETHGRHRDGGQYRSPFVAAMWDAYRAQAPGAAERPPFAAIVTPLDGARIDPGTEDPVLLEATAFGIHGIAAVRFRVNGVDAGPPVTEPPYRHAWDITGSAPGPYTWTAVATDRRGNTFTSAPVAIRREAGEQTGRMSR